MCGPQNTPLADSAIRALVLGDKPIKKADEKGLFLLLQPSGSKLWRLKYRFNGKEKMLGLGQYPEISLKEARRQRDEARRSLSMGIETFRQPHSSRSAKPKRSGQDHRGYNLPLDTAKRGGGVFVPGGVFRKRLEPLIGDMPLTEVDAYLKPI